jgi:uncharacterized protein YijF (DUF1287 family)
MAQGTVARPAVSEYAAYYERYIALVPPGDVVAVLKQQIEETLQVLRAMPEAKGDFRYAPDKWSVKEVVGHLIDSERIFGCRALRFARKDATPLPGFEQDDYVRNGDFVTCRLQELAAEFGLVRQATVAMLQHLGPAAWDRRGVANKAEVTVRALAYIMAGHERHHLEILRTRYL